MKQNFGRLPDGRQADLYWIGDEYTQAAFTNLGAAIVRWLVPDAAGRKDDIVLGYDSAQEYFQNPGMMGAIVGRNANRIKDAQYSLNGTTYSLTPPRARIIFIPARTVIISVCGMLPITAKAASASGCSALTAIRAFPAMPELRSLIP